jgi:hypothetical protein
MKNNVTYGYAIRYKRCLLERSEYSHTRLLKESKNTLKDYND